MNLLFFNAEPYQTTVTLLHHKLVMLMKHCFFILRRFHLYQSYENNTIIRSKLVLLVWWFYNKNVKSEQFVYSIHLSQMYGES